MASQEPQNAGHLSLSSSFFNQHLLLTLGDVAIGLEYSIWENILLLKNSAARIFERLTN